jgi:hypothetical protein
MKIGIPWIAEGLHGRLQDTKHKANSFLSNTILVSFELQSKYTLSPYIYSYREKLQQKPTIVLALFAAWLFWFIFFLSVGL